jgi:hypothetical protein
MTKKISPSLIKEAILAEAIAIKRKNEIFEELKRFDLELATLNEVGMVGSFGFAAPNDVSNNTKTGFVDAQPLSYVKQLMDDFKEEATPVDEITSLKEENERLKSELKGLKNKTA